MPDRSIALSSLTFLALLAACDSASEPTAPVHPSVTSAEVSRENFQIQIEATFDCTAAGGEIVDVSGTLHVADHLVQKEDGSFSLTVHSNAQGIRGIGRSTGAQYQAPGMGLFLLHSRPEKAGEFTFLDLTHLVRTGPGGDGTTWGARFLNHVTVTPAGQITEHTVDAGDCVAL
jgi:hypothetical protein